jgi:hypothetical protein
VRTAQVIQSARIPEVMKTFLAIDAHSPSPSRTAVQRRLATSDPPPGSVMARAAILSPRSTGGYRHLLQCFAAVAQHRRHADVVRKQTGHQGRRCHCTRAMVDRERVAQRLNDAGVPPSCSG